MKNKFAKDLEKYLIWQNHWQYSGDAFYITRTVTVADGVVVSANFRCDLHSIRVSISRWVTYSTEEFIAEYEATTTADAIQWAADALWEIHETLEVKLAKYRIDKIMYDKIAKEPITLKQSA